MQLSAVNCRRSFLLFLVIAALAATLVPIGVGGASGDERTDVLGLDGAPAVTGQSPERRITPALANATGTVRVVVRFGDVSGATPGSASTGERTVERLQSRANRSQSELLALADKTPGVRVEREFWVVNAALVTVDVDRVSLERVAGLEGVRAVHKNVRVTAATATANPSADVRNRSGPDSTLGERPGSVSTGVDARSVNETTYGPARIAADDARATYDTRGDGVRVAVLDTGIDTNHSDLALPDEEADWAHFDDEGEPVDSEPFDDNGHGTLVSGVVAGGTHGGRQYGVAPDVHLMNARVLDPTATFAQIVAGMEWAIERDADVISMSFGTPGFHEAFVEPIRNVRESGAVVVAAAGNRGHNTSNAPANVYDAFAVGASDDADEIWPDSSGERIETDSAFETMNRPGDWPEEYAVPDVVAPGASILSAYPTDGNGQDRYSKLSGTSMATPHVAGAIALVAAAVEERNMTQVQRALAATASKPVIGSNDRDTRHGRGIINVTAAIEHFDGTLNGTVRAATTGAPIVGANVTVLDNGSRVATARTDSTGAYDVTVSQGVYDLRIGAGGYDATTLSNVTIEARSTVTGNATLAGNVTVTGNVVDVHAGTPIANASVTLTEAGTTHNATTGPGGRYTFEGLNATGAPYELAADALGYQEMVVGAFDAGGRDVLVRNVSLSGTASVRGTVRANGTDSLPENVTVTASGATGTYVGTVTDGTYTIPAVPAINRTYTIEAAARAFETTSTAVTVNGSVSVPNFVLSRQERYLGIGAVESPAAVDARDSYEVTATVANLGASPVNDTVTYVFGDHAVRSASVTLNATEETTITFEHENGTAGTYTHAIRTPDENSTQRLEIEASEERTATPQSRPVVRHPYQPGPSESRLTVDGAVSPANVTVGAPVSITVDVHNSGTETARECVRVAVRNTTVGSATITVPDGETTTIEHRYVPDSRGTFDVTVANETVEQSAECDPPGAVTGTITVGERSAPSRNGSESNETPTEPSRTATETSVEPERGVRSTVERRIRRTLDLPPWGLGLAGLLATLLVGLGLRSRSP